MKNQSDENIDFFDFLIENQLERITSVTITAVVVIIMPALLYSIVWYEKYFNDAKRTLLNRLVAMNCRTGIYFSILSLAPEILRFTYGSFSEKFCFFHIVFKGIFSWAFLFILDATVITRYMFIFWLKNPVAFQDHFWCRFIEIWIYGASFISMFVWHYAVQFQTMGFYFCAGKDPTNMRQHFPKAYGVLETFSLVLHFIIQIKILSHKRKSNQLQSNNFLNSVVQTDKKSLFNYALNICAIFFITSVILAIKMTERLSKEELSSYPNYVAFFYINLLAPSLVSFAIAISFFKDKTLRETIIKEAKRRIQSAF